MIVLNYHIVENVKKKSSGMDYDSYVLMCNI